MDWRKFQCTIIYINFNFNFILSFNNNNKVIIITNIISFVVL